MLIGTYQIAGRYVRPEWAAPWANEVGVYVVVWAVFIAGSNLVATDSHVRPDLVLRVLSRAGSPRGGDRQQPGRPGVLRRPGANRADCRDALTFDEREPDAAYVSDGDLLCALPLVHC